VIPPLKPDPLGVRIRQRTALVALATVPTAIVVSMTALERVERSLARVSSLFVRLGRRIRRPFQLERIGADGQPEHYVGFGRWRP